MTTELVKSISVTNLLAQRGGIIERLERIRRLMIEVDELARTARIADDADSIKSTCRLIGTEGNSYSGELPLYDEQSLESARKRIDAAAWDLLMRESGLMTFMDSQAREEWGARIRNKEIPELTAANIEATFESLYEGRGTMFERGAINCFRNLSWNYKANLPQKFGRRIVLHIRSYGWVDDTKCNQLEDLQRVMASLDGKPQDDHRQGLYQRLSNAERGPMGRRAQFQHDDAYMAFRVYGNGNAHVTFTRPDLVEKVNAIIAKHYPNALPAPRD